MKKVVALVLVAALALSMAACGKKTGGNDGTDAPNGDPAEITGTEYGQDDGRTLSALCPTGWVYIPVSFAGEADEDAIQFAKGIDDPESLDVFSASSIKFDRLGSLDELLDMRDLYDDTKDVEFEAGGVKWSGFTGTMVEGYLNFILTAEKDGAAFEASGTMTNSKSSFTFEDADVLAIFASVKAL